MLPGDFREIRRQVRLDTPPRRLAALLVLVTLTGITWWRMPGDEDRVLSRVPQPEAQVQPGPLTEAVPEPTTVEHQAQQRVEQRVQHEAVVALPPDPQAEPQADRTAPAQPDARQPGQEPPAGAPSSTATSAPPAPPPVAPAPPPSCVLPDPVGELLDSLVPGTTVVVDPPDCE